MDLVEFADDETNDGTALFKTVEAFSGAFFFSTSMELKTKGAGGGRADREIIDSNTSLPSILTPWHFLADSDIFFERSDFRQIFSAQLWLSYSYDHICDLGDNLLRSKIECFAGRWW